MLKKATISVPDASFESPIPFQGKLKLGSDGFLILRTITPRKSK
jgi:hypothetical protein